MLRKWASMVFLVGIVALAGCASDKGSPSSGEKEGTNGVVQTGIQTEIGTELLNGIDADKVREVQISRSLGRYGQANMSTLGTFTEAGDVQTIIRAIGSAEKMSGILNVREPDYDIEIVSGQSRKKLHLWLDTRSDRGLLMDVNKTGTGFTLPPDSDKQFKELIAKLNYTPEQAALNGDVVNVLGKLMNLDKWNSFTTNLKDGKSDFVQVTSYTDEGDPIFHDLIFDGKVIKYTYDSTMDGFGSPERKTVICKAISGKTTDRGKEYTLSECDGEDGGAFLLVVPVE